MRVVIRIHVDRPLYMNIMVKIVLKLTSYLSIKAELLRLQFSYPLINFVGAKI